ncbi:MAG: FtsX-like permease family protein [Bacteroidetes bacterium]|nr:FtsX-like permease family protein [Bacteroidota bacterium]
MWFNRLNLKIARIHLFSKKKQTVIASLGVTFGIAMFVLMISVMTGVNKLLEDTQLTSTPHVRIYRDVGHERPTLLSLYNSGDTNWNLVHHQKPKDEPLNLRNGLLIARSLEKNPAVLGVSPQVSSQVFFNYGPAQLSGMLVGVDMEKEDRLYNVRSKVKSGSLEALVSSNDGILMGKGLADKMQVKAGDKVTVTTPKGDVVLLRVVGTFQMGIGAIDNVRCYTSLQTVQKILQQNTRYITDIHVKLLDLNKSTPLAREWQDRFGYRAEDWETANATILVSFTIRNIMTGVVVMTLLVVAGFGIYNIMNMTVYDKMKDIAIMKATGFESKDIIGVFISQAAFIGLMGAVVGLCIGYILSYLVSRVPFDGGEFLSVDHFPVNFDPKFYVFGIVFGVVTTILAGYFPSRKASKVDPVEILRG